jgi:hypothetical protein
MTAELKRDARRVADSVRGRKDGAVRGDRAVRDDGAVRGNGAVSKPKLRAQIYAWQDVVLNRDASCSRCKRELGKGEHGSIGLQDDATADKVWLCPACAALL